MKRPSYLYGLLLGFCGALPLPAISACHLPLPSDDLHALDDRVDADPGAVLKETQRLLSRTSSEDHLRAAELLTLKAAAANMQDDDDLVRESVESARAQLAALPASEATRELATRLTIEWADALPDQARMGAAVNELTDAAATLPQDSLDSACLLIVRGRVNSELLRSEQATSDGLKSYRIAHQLGDASASADAAYQLAMTYVRVGLYEDSDRMALEAIEGYRALKAPAALSNALYIRGDLLIQSGKAAEAIAPLQEARGLNAQSGEAIDVAFDDQKLCDAMEQTGRSAEAEQTCLAARTVFQGAHRPDLISVIDGTLAKIALARGQAGSARQLITEALAYGPGQVPARTLPRLYALRAEADKRLGLSTEAFSDLSEAVRLKDASEASRGALQATQIKAQAELDQAAYEKAALGREVAGAHAQAAVQERRGIVGLLIALAGLLVCLALIYLLWTRSRREHALRMAAETLETQSHILSTVRDSVMVVDEHGSVRYANRAAIDLLGSSSGTLVGLNLAELGIPDNGSVAAQGIAGRAADGEEIRLRSARGAEATLIVRRSQVRLSEGTVTVCVLQDVTLVRAVEQAALSSTALEHDRMSAELHEGLAQDLAGLGLMLDALKGSNGSAHEAVALIGRQLKDAVERLRRLAVGLSPLQMSGGSLCEALTSLIEETARETGLQMVCHCSDGNIALNPVRSECLYRMAKARLSELVAYRKRADLHLDEDDGAIELRICDDSAPECGCNATDSASWRTMVYLNGILGGSLQLQPTDNFGTACVIRVAPEVLRQ